MKRGKGKRRRGKGRGSGTSFKGIRQATDEGELYAVVIQVLGGANCRVMCQDGELRLCVIRAKFRGRRRHANRVGGGSWVLVGVRTWEGATSGKQKCDLLCIYTDDDITRLKKLDASNPQGVNSSHLDLAWRQASLTSGGAGAFAVAPSIDGVECIFDEAASGTGLLPARREADALAVGGPDKLGIGEEIDEDEI